MMIPVIGICRPNHGLTSSPAIVKASTRDQLPNSCDRHDGRSAPAASCIFAAIRPTDAATKILRSICSSVFPDIVLGLPPPEEPSVFNLDSFLKMTVNDEPRGVRRLHPDYLLQ